MTSRFRQQLAKYLFVLHWLMRDFVWRYRWRAGILTVLRFGGMALQLSTFGLLAKYARMLETNETIRIPWGEEVVARESMVLLGIVGLASLIAMIAGSALILVSSRKMEHLCAEYEAFCGKRVLKIAGLSSRLDRPVAIEGDDEQFILRLCKQYPRFLRRVTKTILTSLLPSLVVVAAVLPLLFMLNVWLTALVVVLASLSLTAHYRLNVKAAQSSLIIERTARESLHEFRNVLGQIREHIAPLDDQSIEKPFSTKSLRRNLDAYFTRVIATTDSQFISDCLTAIILVAVLVTLGGTILQEGEGWASLLVYLLALRYTMSQLKGALTGFSVIARFFHQTRAYFLFVTSEHDSIDIDGQATIDSLTIQCTTKQPLPGSMPHVTLQGGDSVAVYSTLQPTRFQVRSLYGLLLGEGTECIQAALSRTTLVADGEGLSRLVTCNGHHAPAIETAAPAKQRGLQIAVAGERVCRSITDQPSPLPEHANSARETLFIALTSKSTSLQQLPVDFVIVVDGERVSWIGPKHDLPEILPLLEPATVTKAGSVTDDLEHDPAFEEAM